MVAKKLPTQSSVDIGIALTSSRGQKITVRREHEDTGFDTYIIENQTRREILKIPRFCFEIFRHALSRVLTASDSIEGSVEFKGKTKFRIESAPLGLKISAVDGREGAEGQMIVTTETAKNLLELLHDVRLEHGSDVLGRILAYHRLFKFTFAEGSESLNSGLALRTDVLSQVDDFVPTVGRRAGSAMKLDQLNGSHGNRAGTNSQRGNVKPDDLNAFKSRLGERDTDKAWSVDYQALFGSTDKKSAERQPKVNTEQNRKEGGTKHVWNLPLLNSEVKTIRRQTLRCELSANDMKQMRETFLTGRDTEFFLGFEIIDAIFKNSSGKLKSFRFPLYYMPVSISESGRQILIDPDEDARIYLNHLALATLVESFADESNLEAAVDHFFRTLLAQKVEFNGRVGRIYLSRELPVADEIFLRVREIILGGPGENGLGGLFAGMSILGAECDTESVAIYKASKVVGPLQRALERDLESMQEMAERNPDKFARTLPGRFLNSNHRSEAKSLRKFSERPLTPFFRPQSTRLLMEKLNHHDVVLLEGPPGTGKTFTIMNLLIHAVCSGQKILIVSDQEGALHALNEKVEEYLLQGSQPYGRDPVAIWRRSMRLVDKLNGGHTELSQWCRTLEDCLGLEDTRDFAGDAGGVIPTLRDIEKIDHSMATVKTTIKQVMDARIGPKTDLRHRVSPKRGHATTVADIDAFVSFLAFMGGTAPKSSQAKQARRLIRDFVLGREYLSRLKDPETYELFNVPDQVNAELLGGVDHAIKTIDGLLSLKPKSVQELSRAIGSPLDNRLNRHLFAVWTKIFPAGDGGIKQFTRLVASFFQHPGKAHLRKLLALLRSQRQILAAKSNFESGVWRQLQIIHEALGPSFNGAVPLSLEVCRFVTTSSFTFGHAVDSMPSVQELLEQLQELDRYRSEVVRKIFIGKLGKIMSESQRSKEGQSNALTAISGMIHGLKGQDSLDLASGAWREFQGRLLETFPVWMCRKQAVSFLFPCKAKEFDIVIVDEATQCRVDDALPLMFRARKFMVVGDDKQTVLAKDSVIDDYLFSEFNLDEHLRNTQARGIKGGGSHIFGLVKGIKEASVMLDEHYRCPPDIIEYSNRYVYNSELKVMQWRRKGEFPATYIDWSERLKPDSARPDSGSFKGIETDMVDRYLDWVGSKIREIEAQTGQRINMETDVALVYFLLKNEPYIKSKKSEFLTKLGRGHDVLDGAGAALQGKERPYIFYLWDINRGNMMAFRQGDDPDKRKGELNVLMSRPKRRAYHFLHKNFDELDHEKASITDFLWKAWKRQNETSAKVELVARRLRPGPEFFPWRRSSGQLMQAILKSVLATTGQQVRLTSAQTSVVVGNPQYKVDLVIAGGSSKKSSSIGIVDLCGFDWHENCVDDIVDYYFQLCRAEPTMKPVFLFMHEMANPRSRGFLKLLDQLTASVK